MGVMPCSRNGCEKIMCDTYTSEGYICYECKSEFEDIYKGDNLKKKFHKFMNSEKSYNSAVTIDIDWDKM